jgi:hypothetical protein
MLPAEVARYSTKAAISAIRSAASFAYVFRYVQRCTYRDFELTAEQEKENQIWREQRRESLRAPGGASPNKNPCPTPLRVDKIAQAGIKTAKS